MNQKLYSQLRERINKHCPHLLELEFGCEIAVKEASSWEKHLVYNVWYITSTKLPSVIYTCCGMFEISSSSEGHWERDSEKGEYKILGKPPVLSDVLMAIKMEDKNGLASGIGLLDATFKQVIEDWDLSKPLLSDQSDELGNFLLEIIK